MIIEYKVRPVTRYIVTRFQAGDDNGTGAIASGCETKGEFANPGLAYDAAHALCRDEREKLGWPMGDERIKIS